MKKGDIIFPKYCKATFIISYELFTKIFNLLLIYVLLWGNDILYIIHMNSKRFALFNGLWYLKIIYPPNLYKSKICFKFVQSLFFWLCIWNDSCYQINKYLTCTLNFCWNSLYVKCSMICNKIKQPGLTMNSYSISIQWNVFWTKDLDNVNYS